MAIVVSDTNIPDVPPTKLIAGLCDASGSMDTKVAAAREGFNDFILQQRKEKDKTEFMFMTFSSEGTLEIPWQNIRQFPFLEHDFMKPVGGTPLYDSILTTIIRTVNHWVNLNKKPQVVVAVLTDGQENGSNHSLHDVQRMIAARCKDGWQFIFIACDDNCEQQALAMGFTTVLRYDAMKPETIKLALREASIAIADMRTK